MRVCCRRLETAPVNRSFCSEARSTAKAVLLFFACRRAIVFVDDLPAADVELKRPDTIRGCAADSFCGFAVVFGEKYGILYM